MPEVVNGVGWFEIDTDDPAAAERFYGGLFGWSFVAEENAGVAGFREVETPDGSIGGGLFDTAGQRPNSAVFYVQVADVARTVAAAETVGGTVVVPCAEIPGGLVFANLRDPGGNTIGVYTPAAADA